MRSTWQMIPRYHPQISPWDISCSLFSHQPDAPLRLSDIESLSSANQDNVFWLNGATAALYVMLRAMNLPSGSGVGVSVYTCVTVFEAIAAAGLRCIFVDIDTETFSFDIASLRKKRDQISAIILIHTFGFAGNIDEVKNVVGDCPIIEDCAHALGSCYHGRHVGLSGTAGVFSFNIHKPLSAGGGGLLVVNCPSYIPAVKKLLDNIQKNGWLVELKNAAKLFLKSAVFRPPWYGLLVAAGFVDLRRHGAFDSDVQVKLLSPLNQRLIARGLNRLELRWEKQRANGREIIALAGNMPPACNFIRDDNSWNGYLLPVLLKTRTQRDVSLEYFNQENVDAFVLWSECLETAGRFGYRIGNCPCFEDAFERMLLLPCYAELTELQLKRLKDTVKAWHKTVNDL